MGFLRRYPDRIANSALWLLLTTVAMGGAWLIGLSLINEADISHLSPMQPIGDSRLWLLDLAGNVIILAGMIAALSIGGARIWEIWRPLPHLRRQSKPQRPIFRLKPAHEDAP